MKYYKNLLLEKIFLFKEYKHTLKEKKALIRQIKGLFAILQNNKNKGK